MANGRKKRKKGTKKTSKAKIKKGTTKIITFVQSRKIKRFKKSGIVRIISGAGSYRRD